MSAPVVGEQGPVPAARPLSVRQVWTVWFPLAASWLLMSWEQPMQAAVLARLADPVVHLAAWGGIVYPLALIIESPIIMLLAASTALSREWGSYRKLYRFMMAAGAALTALHLLVALTPLYDLLVVRIIGAPPEIAGPGRIGLLIMTPWSWTIAYRRFQQGTLIRFGHSRAVGIGTLVRLGANGAVLAAGYALGTLPGIVVGSAAIAAGVTAEAVYAGLRVRPVLRDQVRKAPPVESALTLRTFLAFYIPLSLTSLLSLLGQPLISFSLNRMPLALESLAVWPVVSGFVSLLRSPGMAYNEVVVALAGKAGARRALWRFTLLLVGLTSAVLLLVTATPLAEFWFGRFSDLAPALALLAGQGLWLALPQPGLNVLQSWYQGRIVHGGRTRGISEAVAIFLLSAAAVLLLGALLGKWPGLYVGLVAFTVGMALQTAWLWYKVRAEHVDGSASFVQNLSRQEQNQNINTKTQRREGTKKFLF